jgi:hypothetical protein
MCINHTPTPGCRAGSRPSRHNSPRPIQSLSRWPVAPPTGDAVSPSIMPRTASGATPSLPTACAATGARVHARQLGGGRERRHPPVGFDVAGGLASPGAGGRPLRPRPARGSAPAAVVPASPFRTCEDQAPTGVHHWARRAAMLVLASRQSIRAATLAHEWRTAVLQRPEPAQAVRNVPTTGVATGMPAAAKAVHSSTATSRCASTARPASVCWREGRATSRRRPRAQGS